MRAIQIETTGGPEVLTLVERPEPAPGPGEVLVRAEAIGVGKPDVLFRTGVYRWMPPLPAIPGAEMAGRIAALGAGVTGLAVGQKVLVYHFKGGCYAEAVAVPAASVRALPETVDLTDAVALPNTQVAWALLHEAARGIAAKTVYVNGAAGGVGSAVIQICRHEGLKVIAGAGSAKKCAFAATLGAAHTIDYSREPVADRLLELTGGAGVDLMLDHIIGPKFTDMFRALAPLGLIVSFNMLGGFPAEDVFKAMRANLPRSPALRCFTMHSFDHDPDARERVAAAATTLLASGAVKPAIHAVLPLADARRAHEMLDAREVFGKLVLKP